MRHIHSFAGNRRDVASRPRIEDMKPDRLVFSGGGLPNHIVFCYVQLDVIQKGSFISLEINLGEKRK